jgi:hypothetical protein
MNDQLEQIRGVITGSPWTGKRPPYRTYHMRFGGKVPEGGFFKYSLNDYKEAFGDLGAKRLEALRWADGLQQEIGFFFHKSKLKHGATVVPHWGVSDGFPEAGATVIIEATEKIIEDLLDHLAGVLPPHINMVHIEVHDPVVLYRSLNDIREGR